MKHYLLYFLCICLFACSFTTPQLQIGTYRATLKVDDQLELPFNFEVTSPNTLKIYNADEVILVEDVSYSNDSVYIKMPVFDGYIAAQLLKGGNLEGAFIKDDLNRTVPFKATPNTNYRFESSTEQSNTNITGNWETVFSPNSEEDRYIAKGIFKQKGNSVTGTFRTTTGDYRYLEGVLHGNQLQLSTFDGSHAFLFTATVTDSSIVGEFYSGNHWKEPFIAKRNDTYELPDANALTYLKEGYNQIEFSFPNVDGENVSLNDAQFKNKVVLVQIMGTWCPNCLDESKFYSEYYKNNQDKDIEIVALAFEYAKTPEAAFNNIKRLQDNAGIEYPVLLAQYGSSSKTEAQQKLPMLNHVLSYPTTIYIDKKGEVRKIHTGFNGPATGEKFSEFKMEFNNFVQQLLDE